MLLLTNGQSMIEEVVELSIHSPPILSTLSFHRNTSILLRGVAHHRSVNSARSSWSTVTFFPWSLRRSVNGRQFYALVTAIQPLWFRRTYSGRTQKVGAGAVL